MLLAIDVGNTNTVFAIHDGTRMVANWRIQTRGRRTADEYFVWLTNLMNHQHIGRKHIDAIIIGSVAPETLFNLRRLAETYFNCRPLVVGEPDVDLGVGNKADHPAEVGADRLINTLAAYTKYGPNLVVLDFGTGTTFDVVDEDGAYAGGVIAPGVNLASEALYQAAAKLPRIEVARPAQVIGTNTVACMQSGIYWGYVGLIEGILNRIDAERETDMKVIATGGLAPLFAQGVPAISACDQDLTLRGLVEIYRRNVGRTNRR